MAIHISRRYTYCTRKQYLSLPRFPCKRRICPRPTICSKQHLASWPSLGYLSCCLRYHSKQVILLVDGYRYHVSLHIIFIPIQRIQSTPFDTEPESEVPMLPRVIATLLIFLNKTQKTTDLGMHKGSKSTAFIKLYENARSVARMHWGTAHFLKLS